MDFSGKQFSKNGYIENNLKALIEENIKNGTGQVVVLVVGGSNTGKTSLSLLSQNYITGDVNTDNIALNHEEFIEAYTTNPGDPTTPPKKTIIYEEGRESFFRANNITTKNKQAKNSLFEYRSFQNVLFINFQDISDFAPKPILNNLIDFVIRTPDKGIAHLFSQQKAKSMFTRGSYTKFTGWTDPDVVDYFDDPKELIPDKWRKYEKQNLKKLNTDDNDKTKTKNTSNTLDLTQTQKEYLEFVKSNGKTKTTDFKDNNIANSRQDVYNITQKLVDKNLLKKETGKENRFTITKEGETVLDLLN